MKNILILMILITLTGCQHMKNQSKEINSEKINNGTIIEENKIYEIEVTKVEKNEYQYPNWNPTTHPHIIWNEELNTTREVLLRWKNIDKYSDLTKAKIGDKKIIIFKVIKVYTVHEHMLDMPDILSLEAECEIVRIK